MKYINLSPAPAALMESMRDIGYSLETAVADIIDNSIAAESKRIDIRFSYEDNPWLSIIDDGHGMSKATLLAAMRLGSMSPLEERCAKDLGRFGLGLKTASFSQCRSLTVLSKYNGTHSCCCWDLDTIQDSSDKWNVCIFSNNDINRNAKLSSLKKEYLDKRNSGTIILLQKMDRIVQGDAKESRESRFDKAMGYVRKHLELVFHRYLSPEPGQSKVYIYFNNAPIEAFDPFYSTNSTELREEEFRFKGERIIVQPYVLPHRNKVSNAEWIKYAGPQGYLHLQGFYVYRNRRLIINSTWFRLISKSETTKLLRVKVDIPNSLDHLWKIDVKKSNAMPPAEVREELKRIIGQIEDCGKRVYRQRGQNLSKTGIPAWNRITKENQIFYEINKEHPLITKHIEQIPKEQQNIFSHILDMLEYSFPKPTFYNDFATDSLEVNTKALTKEQVEGFMSMFLDFSKEIPTSKIKEILQIDPFVANRGLVEQILKEKGYEQ